jgi:hypothetical protein
VGVGNPKGTFRPPSAAIFGSEVMETQAGILAMCLLAVVAYGDVRTRRIPNVLVCAIAVLGLLRMTVAGDAIAATHTIEASGAVLAVGFLASWRRCGRGRCETLDRDGASCRLPRPARFSFRDEHLWASARIDDSRKRPAPSMLLASLATGRQGVRGVGRRMRRNLNGINRPLRDGNSSRREHRFASWKRDFEARGPCPPKQSL